VQRVPEAADADGELQFGFDALLELIERGVGLLGDPGQELRASRFVELGLGAADGLGRIVATLLDAAGPGGGHPQLLGNFRGGKPLVVQRQHPLPQIHRIRHRRPPGWR
jgi:hypothetical protein